LFIENLVAQGNFAKKVTFLAKLPCAELGTASQKNGGLR